MAKKVEPKDRKTDLQVAFGKIIRAKRLEQDLSQEELAHKSNLHFTYVSSTERGERNISLQNIAKLAQALKCKIKDIVKDID